MMILPNDKVRVKPNSGGPAMCHACKTMVEDRFTGTGIFTTIRNSRINVTIVRFICDSCFPTFFPRFYLLTCFSSFASDTIIRVYGPAYNTMTTSKEWYEYHENR